MQPENQPDTPPKEPLAHPAPDPNQPTPQSEGPIIPESPQVAQVPPDAGSVPPTAPAVPVEIEAPALAVEPLDNHPDAAPAFEAAAATQPIQWQSPEYIAHPKPPIWFIAFWLLVVVLMAIAAFVVKSWSFTVLVPVMAAALMIYSHRPPRVLNYVLSAKGLYINDVLHPLSEFRTFGIIQDETIPALMLIPVKRFRPGLTVYFPQENGEAIVDLLGSRIPMEELRLDVFDQIVRKLRI